MKLHIFIIVIIFLITVSGKNLPSFIEVCHKSLPDIGSCLQHNIEILRPRFKEGIPEMYIPSFNPLRISQIILKGNNIFQAIVDDIEVYNADNFEIKNVKFDATNGLIFSAQLTFPEIRIKGKYKVNGQILILQLNTTGMMDGNFTNVKADLKCNTFLRKDKNNREWLQISTPSINLKIGKMSIYFDRIFGDNEQLNKQTNQFINENAQNLFEELQPVLIKAISEFTFELASRIFRKWDFDELFPK